MNIQQAVSRKRHRLNAYWRIIMDSYLTVKQSASGEMIERKSRFIGTIKPVTTEEEAREFINSLKTKFYDANHNCFAFTLHKSGIMRYSDDGEPGGTAGIPMLEVLKKEKLWNTAVVATRYFGGIHLGAGGLVRAYTATAKLAIDSAVIVEMCLCTTFMLEIPYSLYERALIFTEENNGHVTDTDFTDNVTLTVKIKTNLLEAFTDALREFSNGKAEPVIIGEDFSAIGE